MASGADHPTGSPEADWAAFTALSRMTNHWDRPGWRPGRTAYYWYLGFGDQPEVQALAAQCQGAIAGPQFDLVDATELHMTLVRVAFAEEIDSEHLDALVHSASRRLAGFGVLQMRIGPLAGSAGALSFSAEPRDRINELRSLLSFANQDVGIRTDDEDQTFRPHVGIAYCNQQVDARAIITRVQALRTLPTVNVCNSEALLVALTRNVRSYSWEAVHRIPLTAEQGNVDQGSATNVHRTDPPSSTSSS